MSDSNNSSVPPDEAHRPMSLFTIFSDKQSRWAFIPVILGIIVGFSFWLNWIIVSRWLQQVHHPTVVVSSQKLDSIPAIQGIGFQFPSDLFDVPFAAANQTYSPNLPPSNTLEHFVLHRADPTYPGAALECDELAPRMGSVYCQPTQNGHRLFGNDPNGPFPDLTDPNVWSYQLKHSTEDICVDIYSFVHEQPILDFHQTTEFPYFVPYLWVHLMEPLEIVSFNRFLDGIEPFSNARMMEIISDIQNPSIHEYNSKHAIGFSVSKSVDVNQQQSLTYSVATREQIRLTNTQVNATLQNLFQAKPDAQTRVQGYLSQSDVKLFVVNLCITPQSMTVSTSTETVLYGIWQFMSDCGGFFSTTTIAIAFLFPIVTKVTEPRKFVLFLLLNKFNKNNNSTSGSDDSSSAIKLSSLEEKKKSATLEEATNGDETGITLAEIQPQSDADASTVKASL